MEVNSTASCALLLSSAISKSEKIRKQIEFYLSDNNVVKDKFLGEKIQESIDGKREGWLDIALFLSFRRMQNLGAKVEDIADSFCGHHLDHNVTQNSSGANDCGSPIDGKRQSVPHGGESLIVELSADRRKIRRRNPMPSNDYIGAAQPRTIFLDNLPFGIDHVSLAKLCSEFGRICHVSIPRFQTSREFRGYGFVEFATEEEAIRARNDLDEQWPSLLNEASTFRRRNNKNKLRVLTYEDWLKWKARIKSQTKFFSQHPDAAVDTQTQEDTNYACQERPNRVNLLEFYTAAPEKDPSSSHKSNAVAQASSDDAIGKIGANESPVGCKNGLPRKRSAREATGCILHLKGLCPPLTRLAILQFIQHSVVPQYVDYTLMSDEAWVRFKSVSDTEYFMKNNDRENRFLGVICPVIRRLASKDSAVDYWNRVDERKSKKVRKC